MGKLNVPTDEYAISPKRKFRDLSEEFIEENKDFIVKIPAKLKSFLNRSSLRLIPYATNAVKSTEIVGPSAQRATVTPIDRHTA